MQNILFKAASNGTLNAATMVSVGLDGVLQKYRYRLPMQPMVEVAAAVVRAAPLAILAQGITNSNGVGLFVLASPIILRFAPKCCIGDEVKPKVRLLVQIAFRATNIVIGLLALIVALKAALFITAGLLAGGFIANIVYLVMDASKFSEFVEKKA